MKTKNDYPKVKYRLVLNDGQSVYYKWQDVLDEIKILNETNFKRHQPKYVVKITEEYIDINNTDNMSQKPKCIKCCIRKNTDKIREKLESIGYISDMFYKGELPYLHVYNYPGPFETPLLYGEYDDNTTLSTKTIDCGENEELFFALASMIDGTDKYQWFVSDKSNTFYKCKSDKFDEQQLILANWVSNNNDNNDITWRKATVEEIINKFNLQ